MASAKALAITGEGITVAQIKAAKATAEGIEEEVSWLGDFPGQPWQYCCFWYVGMHQYYLCQRFENRPDEGQIRASRATAELAIQRHLRQNNHG